jgi:hypothetical protein
MANTRYVELNTLRIDPELKARITFALLVTAEAIKDAYVADPGAGTTPAQRKWARYVLNKPESETNKALNLILANYKDLTDAQILNANDATVQGIVDTVSEYLIVAAADA